MSRGELQLLPSISFFGLTSSDRTPCFINFCDELDIQQEAGLPEYMLYFLQVPCMSCSFCKVNEVFPVIIVKCIVKECRFRSQWTDGCWILSMQCTFANQDRDAEQCSMCRTPRPPP